MRRKRSYLDVVQSQYSDDHLWIIFVRTPCFQPNQLCTDLQLESVENHSDGEKWQASFFSTKLENFKEEPHQ